MCTDARTSKALIHVIHCLFHMERINRQNVALEDSADTKTILPKYSVGQINGVRG